MPRNLYTEAFDSGYYYDTAHHADTTEHGTPKRIVKRPEPIKPEDDDPDECPDKLNIENLFSGNSQSRLEEDK